MPSMRIRKKLSINNLLREMKKDGLIATVGVKRWAKWRLTNYIPESRS